jgi:hypothetical protein
MCQNFNISTDRRRAIPYYDSESGDSSASTSKKANFTLALRTGTTYSLYALGVQSANSRAEVLYKDLTTGAANDLDDATWATPSNNTSATGSTTNFELFVYYKRTGLIYGARDGTNLWAFSPTGTAWADSTHALAYTNIAQGLVHSQDDVLYIPYDNKIASNNNGTWNDTAFTGPSGYYITSICEYGQYLAIAFSPLSQRGNSRVLLWDRNTSNVEATANIDWGSGLIKVIEELQGYLVGISIAGSSLDTSRITNRILFRAYQGASGAVLFQELTATGTSSLTIAKQKIDDRIFFMLKHTSNGTTRAGVWSVNRNNQGFAIVHERSFDNDTAISGGGLNNFFIVGDYTFISYISNAGTYTLSKTNDTASYTATAIIETVINPGMNPSHWSKKKRLVSVGALYDPLPAAGQLVLKARVNGATSYTTIFTETTDNQVKTESTPIPSGGTYLDTGEEFEFQINSTGGAVVTAILYKYEVMDSNV